MATAPTTKQVEDMIFAEIRRTYLPKAPDTIAFRVTPMQMALAPLGVDAKAFEDAVTSLIEAGLLSHKPGSSFVMITTSGFAHL